METQNMHRELYVENYELIVLGGNFLKKDRYCKCQSNPFCEMREYPGYRLIGWCPFLLHKNGRNFCTYQEQEVI